MGLIRRRRAPEERYTLEDLVGWMRDPNAMVQFSMATQGTSESGGDGFRGAVSDAYATNGIVFALVVARLWVFTEARFQWRRYEAGRPSDLFGDPSLSLLEMPWPNGTTGELLAGMLQDVDLAGNAFLWRDGSRFRRMRPDWVSIALTADPQESLEVDVAGYMFHPGGRSAGNEPRALSVGEVVHWSPLPDPLAVYRGMSWLTPVLREVAADKAATVHKDRFLRNAATPNLAIKFSDQVTVDRAQEFKRMFLEEHGGAHNSGKPLFLGGGADLTPVGSSMRDLTFTDLQGAGETRIAAAAGVPPVIAGFSEGLKAATYSNYAQARRRFADGTIRPLWRSAAASLQSAVPGRPQGAHLWYDDRDIPFLREDAADAADITSTQAQTLRALTDAGYDPDACVAAVLAGDLAGLKGQHGGLFSVQLQPPGTVGADQTPPMSEED